MQTMKPKINDAVELIDAIPSESLAKGAIGVIVEEFTEPESAYEIEFCDEEGVTVAQIALRPNQFKLMGSLFQ
ncbi:uncharacterized protein DUF4926 [Acidovorax sp. 56]|jgi:hypothetical protein|uniref:DUF4926 domain-containing protein n=1 Tax=Acidovorax sp. 56 TaxID=2035205 RepID=UPI000C5CF2F1|nr:DUF4926 domain-containing protein [Acidovorax sp. 56]PIF28162.1 uncharacterized protein DUF4926 [Acidovorax sp. 56]